jgi:hypothetical protein
MKRSAPYPRYRGGEQVPDGIGNLAAMVVDQQRAVPGLHPGMAGDVDFPHGVGRNGGQILPRVEAQVTGADVDIVDI